jgi:N12 class adenine-specific DNA methylase/DNA repair protein RadC/predicted ABC-type ATPase
MNPALFQSKELQRIHAPQIRQQAAAQKDQARQLAQIQKDNERAAKEAADRQKRDLNNQREAEFRSTGRPSYVDADGIIQPTQDDATWQASQLQQQQEAQKQVEWKKAGRTTWKNPVSGKIEPLEDDATFAQKQAEAAAKRAEDLRRKVIDDELTKTTVLASDPSRARLTSTDRSKAEKELKDAQEAARAALITRHSTNAKAVTGGDDWIPFNESPSPEAQTSKTRLEKLQSTFDTPLDDDDLADLEADETTAPAAAQIRSLKEKLASDDENATWQQSQAERVFDLKLKRENPQAWAERRAQRLATLSPTDHAKALEAEAGDFVTRVAEHEAQAAPLIQQQTAFQNELTTLETQAAEARQRGIPAGELVTLTGPDGTAQDWPKALAETYLRKAQEADTWQTQNRDTLDLIQTRQNELQVEQEAIATSEAERVQKAKAERQAQLQKLTANPLTRPLGEGMTALDTEAEQRRAALDAKFPDPASPQAQEARAALDADIEAKATAREDQVRQRQQTVQEAYAEITAQRTANPDEPNIGQYFVTARQKLVDTLGVTPKEADVMLDDQLKLDWTLSNVPDRSAVKAIKEGGNKEPTRILSSGDILVNPDLLPTEKASLAAIESAPASKEAKARAIAALPALRQNWAQQMLPAFTDKDTPFFLDFNEWRNAKLEKGGDFNRQKPAEQLLAYLDERGNDSSAVKMGRHIATGLYAGLMDLTTQGLSAASLLWSATPIDYLAGGAISQGLAELAVANQENSQAVSMTAAYDQAGLLTRGLGQGARILPSLAPSLAGGAAAQAGLAMAARTAIGARALTGLMAATKAKDAKTALSLVQTQIGVAGAGAAGGVQTTGAQYAEIYGELRAKGIDGKPMSHKDAHRAAVMPALLSGAATAILTTAFGATGAEALLKQGAQQAVKNRFTAVMKGLLKGAVAEQPEEIVDEMISHVIADVSKNPGKDIHRSIGEFLETVPELAIAIGVMGGAGGAAAAFRQPGAPKTNPATGPEPVLPEEVAAARTAVANYQPAPGSPLTKEAAAAALRVARGEFSKLTTAELNSLGWTRENGQYKPLKDYAGPPALEFTDKEQTTPILRQELLDQIDATLPELGDAIAMDEAEAREFFQQKAAAAAEETDGAPAASAAPPPAAADPAATPADLPPVVEQTPSATNPVNPSENPVNPVQSPAEAERTEQLTNHLSALGLPQDQAEKVAAHMVRVQGVIGEDYRFNVVADSFKAELKKLGISGALDRAKARENPLKAPADLDARLSQAVPPVAVAAPANAPAVEATPEPRGSSAQGAAAPAVSGVDSPQGGAEVTPTEAPPAPVSRHSPNSRAGKLAAMLVADGSYTQQEADDALDDYMAARPKGTEKMTPIEEKKPLLKFLSVRENQQNGGRLKRATATAPADSTTAPTLEAAQAAAVASQPVGSRRRARRAMVAMNQALAQWGKAFDRIDYSPAARQRLEGAGMAVDTAADGKIVLLVDLEEFAKQHSWSARSRLLSADTLSEEIIHALAKALARKDKAFSDAEMAKLWDDLTPKLRQTVWDAYNARALSDDPDFPSAPPAETPQDIKAALSHEFLRMLVQQKAFTKRVTEEFGIDQRGLLPRIAALLKKLANALQDAIKGAPKDLQTRLGAYESKLLAAAQALEAAAPQVNQVNPAPAAKSAVTAEDNRAPVVIAGSPAPTASGPASLTTGSTGTAYTDTNDAIDYEWAVVETGDLTISNRDDGTVDPAYPQELQPRDRTSAGSESQVQDIAKNANLDRLSASNTVGDGAPIIGPDGVVESGNGRTMGIRRAYTRGMDSAAAYKQRLTETAASYGLDPAKVASMKAPMLVRVRTTNVDRGAFVMAANVSTIAPKREIEQAKSDAKQIVPDLFETFVATEDGDIFTAANAEFIRGFIAGVIPPAERPAIYDAKGFLSQTGLRRLRNALFVYAYGDSKSTLNALARLTEDIEADGRNLINALVALAPKFGEQNARIAAGALRPLSITQDLAESLAAYQGIKERGETVENWAAQTTLPGVDDGPTDLQKALVTTLHENRRSARKLMAVLNRYAAGIESLGDPKQASLFGDEPTPTQLELWNVAATAEPTGPTLAMAAKTSPTGTLAPANALKLYRKLKQIERENGTLSGTQAQTLQRAERALGQSFFPFAEPLAPQDFSLETEIAWTSKPSQAEQLALFAAQKTPSAKIRAAFPDWSYGFDAYGLPNPPRTLPADSPLLEPTDKKKIAVLPSDHPLVKAGMLPANQEVPRKVFRRALEAYFFRDKTPVPAGTRPVAFASGGGGGAGKSTIIRLLNDKGDIDTKNAVMVNADDIKELIPEYNQIARAGDGRAAAVVHEESSHMAASLLNRILTGSENRYNFVFDATLANGEGSLKKIAQWQAAGFHVHLIGVTIDPQEAMERAAIRGLESGRWVPNPMLDAAHKGFNANIKAYLDVVDSADLFDNTPPNPHQIAYKTDAKTPISVVNQEFWSIIDRRHQDERSRDSESGAEEVGSEFAGSQSRREGLGETALREVQSPREGSRSQDSRLAAARKTRDAGPSLFSFDFTSTNTPSTAAPDLGFTSLLTPAQREAKLQAAEQLDLFGGTPNARPRPTSQRPPQSARPPRTQVTPEAAPGADDLFGQAGLAPATGRPGRPMGDGNPDGQPGGERGSGNDADAGTETGGIGTDPTPTGNTESRPDSDLSGLPGDTGDADAVTLSRPDVGSPARNFEIPADLESLAPATDRAKINANMEAIRLLKELEADRRNATPEEKAVLASYTGWGAFKEAFNTKYEEDIASYWDGKPEYQRQNMPDWLQSWERNHRANHKLLRAAMTDEEFASASASTLNAHYTALPIIRFKWKLLEHLGFKGGRAIESSAGNGHYLGTQPRNLADATQWQTVELDELSARLLAKLYPEATVNEERPDTTGTRAVTGLGFERARIPNGSIDLAISNVPFHESGPSKKGFPTLNLHNFFFAHALDKVKPGGLVAFITSESTMQNNIRQRDFIASKGDLVAAFRLPNNAFKANAGTEVTTDIIIIRKPDGTPFKGEPWRNLVEVGRQNITLTQGKDQSADEFRREAERMGDVVGREFWKGDKRALTVSAPIMVNEYFVNHPTHALGQHTLASTMYRAGGYALVAPEGFDVTQALDALIPTLPANIMGQQTNEPSQDVVLAGRDDKPFSFKEQDGKLYEVQPDGSMEEAEWGTNPAMVKTWRSWRRLADTVQRLVEAETSDSQSDEAIEKLRRELNTVYNTHVANHKFVSRRFSNQHRHLYSDPSYPLTAALENEVITVDRKTGKKTYTYRKADIFSKRVGRPIVEPTTADNIDTAIETSLAWRGRIDPAYAASLLNLSPAQFQRQALQRPNIFRNPTTGMLETAEDYLTGNVRVKLQEAQTAAQDDPQLQRNVDALQKAQPERREISRIAPMLGARWIPAEVYQSFITDVLQGSDTVEYIPAGNTWVISGTGLYRTEEYGTERKGPATLFKHALNMTEPLVYDGSGDDRTFNPSATAAAKVALDKMRRAFIDYSKTSDAQVTMPDGTQLPVWEAVENAFNDSQNSYVTPAHTGSYLTFPGLNTDYVYTRAHRRAVIARFLATRRGMMAHGVGSGKTFNQIILSQELRRLGLAKKPMIVVQNATLGQFAKSYLKAYPGAKILVPTKSDFQAQNRRKLVAKIATGDWDAVLLPHSQFDLISNRPEAVRAYMDGQIDEMLSIVNKTKDKAKVRDLEGMIKRLRDRRQKMLDALAARQDTAVMWEDLGIDALIMDEAHNYKSLPIVTRMGRVKGVPASGDSQRAINFMLKVRDVQARTGGKNIFLATGTPIKNSMAEAYIMMQFMAPDVLEDFKIYNFDDFATTYGQTVTEAEMAWGGTPKMETRFAKFQNGPSLVTMIRTMFDVAFGNEALGLDVPKIKGGEPEMVIVPATPIVDQFNAWTRSVNDAWQTATPDEKEEFTAVPIQTMAAGIAAALDPRLISPNVQDHPDSKVNEAVRRVLAIHKAGESKRTTQIIFSDLRNKFSMDYLEPFTGLPFEEGTEGEFDLYKDLQKKLIAGGVPANEVHLMQSGMTDVQKAALFEKVDAGEIRIIIGSTELLGVGVNIQTRLKAVHHLMPPRDFTPAMMEQRNGRIIRQGNLHAEKVEGQPAWNEEVEIVNYGTEGSMDSAIYGTLARKQRFITQLLMGDNVGDTFDDPTDPVAVNMAEMAARTLGDPDFIRRIELEREIKELRLQAEAFTTELSGKRSRLARLDSELSNSPEVVKEMLARADRYANLFTRTAPRPEGVKEETDITDKPVYEFGGKTIDTAAKDGSIVKTLDLFLLETSKAVERRGKASDVVTLTVNGTPVKVRVDITIPDTLTGGSILDTDGAPLNSYSGAASLIQNLRRLPGEVSALIRFAKDRLTEIQGQAARLRAQLDQIGTFPEADRLAALELEAREVDERIRAKANPQAAATTPAATKDPSLLLANYRSSLDTYYSTTTGYYRAMPLAMARKTAAPSWPENFPNVAIHTSAIALKSHPDYDRAKEGNADAAARVVEKFAKPALIQKLAAQYPNAIWTAVHAEEKRGRNKLPNALAHYAAALTDGTADELIVQSTYSSRTGQNADYRLTNLPEFDGLVLRGRDYILVDDLVSMGGTLAQLRAHIENNGGRVVHITSLAASQFGAKIALSSQTALALESKFGDAALREFTSTHLSIANWRGLTEGEARWVLRNPSLEQARNRISQTGQNRLGEILPELLEEEIQQYLDLDNVAVPSSKQPAAKRAIRATEAASTAPYPLPDARGSDRNRDRLKGLRESAQRAWRGLTGLNPEAIAEAFKQSDTISSLLHDFIRQDIPSFDIRGVIIESPADFAAFNLAVRSPYFEALKIAVIGDGNQVIHSQILSVGSLNETIADPKRIAAVIAAARVANPKQNIAGYLIAHNHPSGNPTPSDADRRMTRRFEEVGALLGVPLMDHVVTNGTRYVSFREYGLMQSPTMPVELAAPSRSLKPKLPILPTPERPGEYNLADWEVVPSSDPDAERPLANDPGLLNKLISNLATGDPGHLHAIYVDTQLRVRAVERIPETASPAKIIQTLIQGAAREGAYALSLGKSHSSNDPTPSDATRRIHRSVREAVQTAALQFLDTLITTPSGAYFSFAENGMAEEPATYSTSPLAAAPKVSDTPTDENPSRLAQGPTPRTRITGRSLTPEQGQAVSNGWKTLLQSALREGDANWQAPDLAQRLAETFGVPVLSATEESAIRELPVNTDGIESKVYLDRQNGVIYKRLATGTDEPSAGIWPTLAYTPDGKLDWEFNQATRARHLGLRIGVMTAIGGTPTEIHGIGQDGHIYLTQPLSPNPGIGRDPDALDNNALTIARRRAGIVEIPGGMIARGTLFRAHVVAVNSRPWFITDLHPDNFIGDTQGNARINDPVIGQIPADLIAKVPGLASVVKQALQEEKRLGDRSARLFAAQKISPQDQAYLAAVKAGDMDTAQRMVEEAATAAGYTIKAFHGTLPKFKNGQTEPGALPFIQFDPARENQASKAGAELAKPGFWFTDSKELASKFSVMAMENLDINYNNEDITVLSVFLRITEPVVISNKHGIEKSKAADIVAAARWGKGDGVIAHRADEPYIGRGNETVYQVRDPNQIKSADPVTRDDQGNVIPLSQRFNPQSDSILYAAPKTPIDTAAHTAATSPQNATPQPTDAQKRAGNYKVGRVQVGPLDISIENPAGSTRSGTDPNGKAWSITMLDHYGYVRGTQGKDGDHIDIFIEPGTPTDYTGPVFVVNQTDAQGNFDEHKAVMGPSVQSEAAARAEYLQNYSPGWKGAGTIARFESVQAFADWAAARRRIAPAKPLPAAPKTNPLASLGWNHLDKSLSAKLAAHARWLNDKSGAGETVAAWLQADKVKPFAALGKVIQRELFPDSVLPREITARMREMNVKSAMGAQRAMDLTRALSGTPKFSDIVYPPIFTENPIHRRHLYEAMAGMRDMASLPQELQDLATRLRKMLVEIGQEAVKQGRMSLDTFEGLRENYMPHFYEEDVAREKSFIKRFALGVKDIFAQRTTAWHVVDTKTKDKTGEPRIVSYDGNRWRFKNKEHRDAWFEDFIAKESLDRLQSRDKRWRSLTLADLNKRSALPDEARGRLQEIENSLRAQYRKEKPLSLSEQEKAGLILDPVYSIARYAAQMVHDNSTAEFFNFVASKPEWISDTATPGFTQVPDNTAFGRLAGKYVENDIHRQLTEMVEAPNAALRLYDTILSWWKTGKTVLNPGTHVRNVLGNIPFATFAGVNPLNPGNMGFYRDSLRHLRNGGQTLTEAYEDGVLGADFVSAELRQTLRQLLPDPATIEESDRGESILLGIGKAIGQVLPNWAKNPAHKAYNQIAALYQVEDEIYKMAAYLKARNMGMSREEAAAHVRHWFPYYDLATSATLKLAQRTGMPFLSFYRESIRIFGHALTERPLALATTLAVPSIITALSAMALGLDDDDLEQIRKDMRGKAGKLLGPTPIGGMPLFSMLLPFRSANGDFQQFDISAIHPFADHLGNRVETDKTEDWWQQTWRSMLTAGPIGNLIYAQVTGRDAFGDRPFVEDNMAAGEKLAARLDNAAKTALPPLTPFVGTGFQTIANAGERSTNKTLELRSPTQAVLRAVVGLDVRNANPDIYRIAEDWRKANNIPTTEGMDFSATTPTSRARKALFAELARPEPNLKAIKNLTDFLDKTGSPVKTADDVRKLLFYRNPLMVIRGRENQQRFRASLTGQERTVLETALSEFDKIQSRAPSLILQARAQ